jgi:molybdopterin-containing oxidoreductase family membrane subunit
VLKKFRTFARGAIALSFRGNKLYYAWMALLSLLAVIGANAYVRQLVHGLGTTGMTDQVAWGVYIANFTFLVGIASAAVMLVIPAYVYRIKEVHDVVLFGELMSFTVILMSLLFVVVDISKPHLFWHMIPGIGILNFPKSLLAWDVVALAGYLVINVYICGYLLYTKYQGIKPKWIAYMPVLFVSIAWAISLHTATAFLYVGLVGRPFWNASIIAPRFLVSAFVSGPALMILALQFIRWATAFQVADSVFKVLRQIVATCLLINLFLLGSELFKELYSADLHNASIRYLFFGLEHHGQTYNRLVPWIWTAVAGQVIAAVVLLTPLRNRLFVLNIVCVLAVVGVWIEKGMGLVVPGFIPTPLGDVIEYTPSLNETLVCMGIWAFGGLLYTWLLKLAVPILTGEFHDHDLEPIEEPIDNLSEPVGQEG